MSRKVTVSYLTPNKRVEKEGWYVQIGDGIEGPYLCEEDAEIYVHELEYIYGEEVIR